ncbi:MAG: Na+/H+ antiporter subunit G [Rubrivivax sp.]|jgi:multicomponent K+:H+ antiporter subunit G
MNTLEQLPAVWQAVIIVLLLVGGLFALVGAIGLVRFRDFYMRLHAPTKATTLGVGGVLLAAMAAGAAQGRFSVAELLIALFIFVTAPVSANLLAQAALHRRERSVAPVPEDQPLP